MTRINCVPPSELCRQHLVAEYRELPRIYRLAKEMSDKGEKPPPAAGPYILGKGHMKSFCNRLIWLAVRHAELIREMKLRGYKVSYEHLPNFISSIPLEMWNDWDPSPSDMALCRARLRERLPSEYQ